MSAKLIDGRAVASQIQGELVPRIEALKRAGVTPKIVFVRVGDDPASIVYVGRKEKAATSLGILSETRVLPADTLIEELLGILRSLNEDPSVHGILVQLPLPRHLDARVISRAISPCKDVDGFHPENMGKLLLGDPDGFRPCTPAGIIELLLRYGVDTSGADVVILGRGNLVGKPLAAMLCQKARGANATVTVCHTATRDIIQHCRRADILIAAMGVPRFVKCEMVKPGAIVIDVGVNRIPDPNAPAGTRLVGDVDFESVAEVASMITPNPGGVGPMTVAMLMQNTVLAAERFAGIGGDGR
jgi:methylenetetrahydrofolate dehydrogenase (NADP+)/methenyltetrahydrofolate cyclohydrolase